MKNLETLQFDTEKYPFHKVIAGFLDTDELDNLKSQKDNLEEESKNSFYKNMEQTEAFKNLYSKLEGEEGQDFYDLFHSFVKEVIRPRYSEAIYYQQKPSHRILFRDIEGKAKFHRDSDYGHTTDEVNYWVPQTDAFKTNTIWIEEGKNSEKYKPAELKLGEFIQFDGASLSHGAFPNETGKTRVSFDFRVIPASKMKEEDKEQATDKSAVNPVMSNARKFAFCE